MRLSPVPLLLLLLLLAGPLPAQRQASPVPAQPGPSSQVDVRLSPRAAYSQAMQPLEMTRHNIANWSDVELAAMQVTITQAREGCLARHPTDFNAADLVDLARLCSLGQQWPAVVDAASRYIDTPDASPAGSRPLLSEAYIAKTEALLRLQQEPAALQTALTLLHAVTFSADVSDVVDEALNYMHYVHTADALKLAAARQPLLLAALTAPSPTTGSTAPATTPALPAPHTLYSEGLSTAALQQLAGEPAAAQATVAALDAALPRAPSGDESLQIEAARRQYALLGKPVNDLHPLAALSMPFNMPPALPVKGAVTAMLLFPDWCAACVHMSSQLPLTVFTVEGHSSYLYALLAETTPQRKLPVTPGQPVTFSPSLAAAMMEGSATVTVAPTLLARYTGDSYPLLLVADAGGVLRILTPLAGTSLQPGGEVDSAIAAVARTFSPKPPPDAKSAPASHP